MRGAAEAGHQLGDVGADAVAAAEDDDALAGEGRLVGVGVGRRRSRAGQLEQLVGQEDVDRVGDLHVLLGAVDHADRHVGQVAQDHAAVVGGGEVRVLPGQLVGAADRGEAERLRGLAAPDAAAVGDVGDLLLLVDHDDRVGGGDGDVDRVVAAQGGDAVSVMIRWSSSGRTASWKSTQQSSSPSALSAVRAVCVVSLRVLPPASTVLILLYGAASRRASARWSPFISRTMSSISGASWNTSRVCSRIVLPATLSSCLGMFRPTRDPVPPARTTATVRRREDIGVGEPSGDVHAPASAPSR